MQQRTGVIRRIAIRRQIRAWLAYVCAGLFVGMQFTLQGSISLMVPELMRDLNIDTSHVGILASLFFVPYVMLQVPSGRLVTVTGVRLLMTIASILLACGCVIFATAEDSSQAMAGRLIMGLGSAPGIICFLETVLRCFPSPWFGLMAAGMELFGMLGAAAGDFLIPHGINEFGWQRTVMFFAGVAGALSLLFFLLLPQGVRVEESTGDQAPAGLIKKVLADSRVWRLALVSGFLFAVINAFAALWAVPFYSVILNDSHAASHAVGMVFIGAAIGAPLQGWLSEQRRSGYSLIAISAMATTVLMAILMMGINNILLLYWLMLLLGVVAGGYFVPFVLLKQLLYGPTLAVALALLNMISVMVGSLVFQPLIGWLLSLLDSHSVVNFQIALSVLPVGAIIGLILTLSLIQAKR